MLEVEALQHRYGDTVALDGLSFAIDRGEIFGLLGPNGGGKTTLFRILTTLLHPAGGRASIAGYDVVADPQAVRQHIGVVFQSPSLDVKLTVRENMVHQGHLHGLHGEELETRIEEMLGRVQMLGRADDLVETLSGGMRRRVDFAKGLLHRPSLVLLDEPTTGLDPGARLDLWRHLEEARETFGLTVLITTHLMEDAERCDQLLIVDQGRGVAVGTPDSLRAGIGGDVIVARSSDPEALAREIRQRLDQDAEVVDHTVRIQRADGHEFVPMLFETFPGRIEALSVGKPTLEDVFVQHTGRHLDEENLARQA